VPRKTNFAFPAAFPCVGVGDDDAALGLCLLPSTRLIKGRDRPADARPCCRALSDCGFYYGLRARPVAAAPCGVLTGAECMRGAAQSQATGRKGRRSAQLGPRYMPDIAVSRELATSCRTLAVRSVLQRPVHGEAVSRISRPAARAPRGSALSTQVLVRVRRRNVILPSARRQAQQPLVGRGRPGSAGSAG